MALKKGLGKGLGSLFGEETLKELDNSPTESKQSAKLSKKDNNIETSISDSDSISQDKNIASSPIDIKAAAVMLRLIDINPNITQPRKRFDEASLSSLAESISTDGLLQPIIVRSNGDGQYIIIAGERRWRAARMAGLDELPAVILDADAARAAELALIENLQREDLNPIEEAEGFSNLLERYGLTQEEIALRVGKSRPAIANALRLLSLDERVRAMLIDGTLSAGHARALVVLDGDAQAILAERAVKEGLSVRQVESIAARLKEHEDDDTEDEPAAIKVDYTQILANQLAKKLGRKVRISGGKRKGKVELEYYNNDDLEHLCDLLSGLGVVHDET